MERNRDDDWRAPQVNTATAGSLPPGGATAGCAARSGRPRTRVGREAGAAPRAGRSGSEQDPREILQGRRCIPPRRGLRARVVTGREAVLEHELGIAPPAPGRPGRGRTAPYLPATNLISVPFGRSDLLQLLLDASFCFVSGLLKHAFFLLMNQ